MKKKMHIRLLNDNNIIKEEHTTCLKTKNTLTFIIDNIKTSIDLENKLLTRNADDYVFTLDILNKNSTLLLKKENYLLHLKVEYAILLTNQNIYEISYLIETHENEMHIIIELEGE